MMRASLVSFLLLSLALACEPTEAPAQAEALGTTYAAIVNGSLEYGWEGVGALTMIYGGYGYAGSFCTATLIDPEWVLTAAHCLTEHEGMNLSPQTVRFFVGTDATASWGGGPKDGDLYEVDAFYIHPEYESLMNINDIGLVHLASPITSVESYPYNQSPMLQRWVGEDVFYVGFGVTNGASQTGGGVKRSTALPIDSIYDTYYAHSYADSGSGVCFGDSGGPGLYEIEGEWRVIGVNSAGDSEGYDPCKQGYSIHTRVDTYADWITQHVTGESPDCADNPDMCLCAEACTADGSCDDALCGDLDCAELNSCLGQCDESDTACYDACYALATNEAAAYIEDLFSCLYSHCNGLTGDGYQSCASVNCTAEIGACFTTETGEAPCEVLADCAADCDAGDNRCVASCMKSGTADAQILARAVVECWSGQCASYAQRSTDWIDCITSSCAGTVDACVELSLCDPLGGDCAAGQACAPTIFGDTDCVASGGASLGAVCDPTLSLPQPCVDGLECIAFGDSGMCARRCVTSSDCPDGVVCERPYFEDVEDYGICLCTDNDHDGWCAEGTTPDCDDAEDAASPGLTERCGDEIDNDCDGQTDEDCENCVDADEDGYCADVDCDDTNDAVHPDGTDLCGDGIDGDCDGVTDGDCLDADGDGFDEGVDCDDTQRWVNPDALERCGDGIDNDCDGAVDENCEGCVDADEDGFCADVDCDDTNSAVRPNTVDLCGDDFDGNCDGVVDDGCGSVGGTEEEPGATSSGSGGCSTVSAAPTSTALLLAPLALFGLFALRRRVRV